MTSKQNPLNDPEPDYDRYEDDTCWRCGGEGYVFDCIDGSCLDADVGCDMCTSRCDVCNSAKSSKAIAQ